MKVLILTSNYPVKNALNNGIFIHQQVKALQQLGVECHVLLLHNWFPVLGLHKLHTYWRQGYNVKQHLFEEYEGVKIHMVPVFVRMPAGIFKEDHYQRAARSVVKFVKKNKALKNADWLYSHFLTDNGYIGALVKDKLHIKLAAIARGDDIHAWPERFPSLVGNLQFVFKKADLVLANSRNLGYDARKWMTPDNVRDVQVVYNGIDHLKFYPVKSKEEQSVLKQQYGLSPDIRYIICVATPVALKGWVELLEAIKETGSKFDGWKLLMVAPVRHEVDAIDLVQTGVDLGIADRLHYVAGLQPDALREVLRACDAFVLPSYNEGMANSLLEAMATGLPCIATEVGGHNEVITQGQSGLLVPPRSVPELAKAIEMITGNNDLRMKMGIKARESMLAFGDYVVNGSKLMELLKKG